MSLIWYAIDRLRRSIMSETKNPASSGDPCKAGVMLQDDLDPDWRDPCTEEALAYIRISDRTGGETVPLCMRHLRLLRDGTYPPQF